MELEKYDLIEEIGVGSYGRVYRAKEKSTKRNIAVKLIKKNASERERKEQKKILKECKIHSSLSHPNIIQMLDSFETVEYIVIATELAETDLHRFLFDLKRRNQEMSEKHVQKLAWSLISALHYLHSCRVLHRDLKPQNVLLNNFRNIDEMQAKLCDFGLARKMTSETYLLTSVIGTPLYMAPEVMLERNGYDEGADLWSIGCIIYEANFLKPPKKTQSLSELFEWLRNPEIPWPTKIMDGSKSFLEGLLKKDPKKRLTWPQIVEHPYVKDNLVILDINRSERPLTANLTTSQQIQKQKQRDEIRFNRGQKMIAAAMIKRQQNKAKLNQKTHDVVQPAKKKPPNVIGDNESISSDDSINAIIQTDLETDVEGPMIKKSPKLPAEGECNDRRENQHPNQNLVIKRYTDNFATFEEIGGDREDKDNTNLKIGTMRENFEQMHVDDENKWHAVQGRQPVNPAPTDGDAKSANAGEGVALGNQANSNTDLVKRKLSQNLENFSIRLGNDATNTSKICNENDKDVSKEKPQASVCTNQSAERSGPDNSDNKQDTYEDDQSPPIENEEWLAFICTSMKELLNGETDSLKNQTLVGIIVAILRNFNASIEVIGSVVQLLSIPFVLPISNEDMTEIQTVYVQTKLLPNLIYAAKMICMVKGSNPSFSSTFSSSNFADSETNQDEIVFRDMSDLSVEELKTLAGIYELVCYLVHLEYDFVAQFRDSVYIIANDLLRRSLSDVVYDSQGMQIVCAIVSTLCFVLRETPGNAEFIETIIFHESVDIVSLINNGNVILKSRLCNFLRIISRFSCFALQKSWTMELKQTLEGLLDDGNAKVKDAAKDTIEEISQLAFYSK